MGYLNREQVVETLKRSKVGIVTLYPKINYLDSQPVKMFEYMAAGIPIIASDFIQRILLKVINVVSV